ncbi:phosphatase PAP2 family protein [Neorhizobium sp. NPDC001467]|uniref:phosphatase PAP2 family protein n=1 Tax=Neorhizobium sp. NPDC001467 TaxID=3390595 RepID=UPI003D014F89
MFLLTMLFAALVFDFARLLHRFNRRRGLAFRRIFSAERMAALVSGILLMGALMFFQGSFTTIKNMLPLFKGGFTDDRFQAELDAWLHLGFDPWSWVHMLGSGLVTRVLEFNYSVLWFALCFGILFFVATSPLADGVRRRYLAMFIFVWIICGNVLAGLFLSAGPLFYGEVVGDHERFAELIAWLGRGQDANIVMGYRDYLWELHDSGKAGFGSGISAFPSVHVALTMMNALFVNHYSRRLGLFAFAYVAVIQFSSVYLGWHYAIDGYVSIVAVTAAYLLIDMLSRRRPGGAPAGLPVPSAA